MEVKTGSVYIHQNHWSEDLKQLTTGSWEFQRETGKEAKRKLRLTKLEGPIQHSGFISILPLWWLKSWENKSQNSCMKCCLEHVFKKEESSTESSFTMHQLLGQDETLWTTDWQRFLISWILTTWTLVTISLDWDLKQCFFAKWFKISFIILETMRYWRKLHANWSLTQVSVWPDILEEMVFPLGKGRPPTIKKPSFPSHCEHLRCRKTPRPPALKKGREACAVMTLLKLI